MSWYIGEGFIVKKLLKKLQRIGFVKRNLQKFFAPVDASFLNYDISQILSNFVTSLKPFVLIGPSLYGTVGNLKSFFLGGSNIIYLQKHMSEKYVKLINLRKEVLVTSTHKSASIKLNTFLTVKCNIQRFAKYDLP